MQKRRTNIAASLLLPAAGNLIRNTPAETPELKLPRPCFFLVPVLKTGLRIVRADNIVAFVAMKKGVKLFVKHAPDATTFYELNLSKNTIEHLAALLGVFSYLQCHRSAIVNLDHVTGLKNEELLLNINIGCRIYIGSTFEEKVKQAIADYLAEKSCFVISMPKTGFPMR